ncbi:hypothetical protein A6M21_08080 [Desulfotomaculum copahuensis]|uniref:Uncharacterized protein n=1 Tax=Desulfotomaculum copahuensis TaxID=1838280 RepID=A0A1B7LFZ8_9FIRM|nr:hypothetical protein A6M21_08080 [Desulfotomaculum copahuensis]
MKNRADVYLKQTKLKYIGVYLLSAISSRTAEVATMYEEPGKISDLQTIFLLVNVVGATAIVLLPGFTAAIAGRDSWLTPILATIPGLYLAFLVGALGRLFPGQTLIQYLEWILGSLFGKAVGLYYVFFF